MFNRPNRLTIAALAALALVVSSCAESGSTRSVAPVAPDGPSFALAAASLPAIRFSELHYDNSGTDANEAIEISGPAGASLEGWQVVLYNGNTNSRSTYNTQTLSGTIPATCGTRGVVVLSYPTNGIQNGGSTATGTTDPDGMALVDPSGTVVEFLSYEGTFTAANGPAAGMLSVDIGVRELGEEPGQSLQRDASGTWTGPMASTFGACNDDGEPTPAAEVATITIEPASPTMTAGATVQLNATALDAGGAAIPGAAIGWSTSDEAIATVTTAGLVTGVAEGDATITATATNGVNASVTVHVDPAPTTTLPPVRFSEIHYDNFGTDANEAIEVEGPAGTDLLGWRVLLYNGNGGTVYDTKELTGTIADMCDGRGVVAVTYPANGIQNGSPDGFALVDALGRVVEFLSYEGVFAATDGPASGMTSVDIGVAESSSPVGETLQRTTSGAWEGPKGGTMGACNGTTPIPAGNTISFSGRTPSDAPLPVGFQDQLFATVRTPGNVVVDTPISWSSETPTIASIDADGVVTGLAEGTAILRATAGDGTTATWSLPIAVATASTTAQYGGNAEFGEPTDADASDDFIVRRAQYTLSFNRNRGTPNWVSYDLEATHFGPLDRCDCFTFDPALPSSFTHYTTADYTGAGAYHGYGIDRGHLARSFDRTSGSLDNATTFYFSNIIPQAADLNQGPWAAMESYLGDLARFENREVYIVAGVAGSKGTVKDEGKITIPAQVWKVALVLPRDQGLANVHSYADVQVFAAIMPNDAGVRNVDWHTYLTTVDAVEAASGYDLLALLPDPIEIAVESGTKPPQAVANGPFSSTEGATVTMSAAGSSDPDGDALTFAWSFGDGATGTGAAATHTYMQDGSYQVRLIATDVRGLADTAFTTATVANVAPTISAFAGATLLPGETYLTSGTFSDPGADAWSATVSYGDGSGTQALALSGKAFSLSHTYTDAGSFTVTVRVADDDDTSTRTATVTVLTPTQALEQAMDLIDELVASGAVNGGTANSLKVKLEAAARQLERSPKGSGGESLHSAINELDAMVQSGRISEGQASGVRTMIARVLVSVGL
jgi:DNA/RNA endonuclease G (NUC1)